MYTEQAEAVRHVYMGVIMCLLFVEMLQVRRPAGACFFIIAILISAE